MCNAAYRAGLAILATGMLFLSGCGTANSRSADNAAASEVGVARVEADQKLPSSSLRDWASYADQLSVVSVLSEQEIPPPAVVRETGEGYIGRSITLHIDDTLWRRPGAPNLEGTLQMTVSGWILRRGQQPVKAVVGKGARPEPGARYLVPLVRYDAGSWGPLGVGLFLPLESANGATIISETPGDTPSVEALEGKSVSAAARAVAETPPDPAAVGYAHLPPEARFQAVARAQMPTSMPSGSSTG